MVDGVLKKHTSEFYKIFVEYPHDYFLALSDSDLSHLENILGIESLEQCESHYSILVKDDKHYYKYIPYSPQRQLVRDLCYDGCNVDHPISIQHLVLPTLRVRSHIVLFQFDAQPHQPLSKVEARKCIRDFVSQAKRALEELHQLKYAHIDVRLPNFCFSHNYEAMLIDLTEYK